MYLMRTNTVAVADIDDYLAGLAREVRQSARDRLLVWVSYALLSLIVAIALGNLLGFVGVVIALMAAIFTWYFPHLRGQIHALAERRVRFLDALLRQLRDDLAPTAKLHVRYLVRPFDDDLNVVKSTKSAAGNTKTYYRSRWLRVYGMLADGTRFRLSLQRTLKRKKGQTLREQSAVILALTPPRDRYARVAGTAEDTGEIIPWGAGTVSMTLEQGTLVFRFAMSEGDALEQVYRAMRYTVARYPLLPDARPAPDASPAPGSTPPA